MKIKLIMIILSLLMSSGGLQAVVIKEVENKEPGKLSTLIDESYYAVDSLIVAGPIDPADMAAIKILTQKGKLTGLNMKRADFYNVGGFWFANNPDDPDSLQVKLKYMQLPDDCYEIGNFAFANVKTLVGIYKDFHPQDVTAALSFLISTGAFSGSGIRKIDIWGQRFTLWPYCFQNAVELESIPYSTKENSINIGAFYNTPKLKGSIQFKECYWLTDRCFSCSGWDEITVSLKNGTSGESQFEAANAKKIVIESDNLKVIPRRAFFGCGNLKSLSLPSSVDTLMENSLNQTGLEVLTLPEGLEHIESNTMGWNILLKEIVLPSTLKYIGWDNGQYLHSLEKIYVKAQTPPECPRKLGVNCLCYAFTDANPDATLYVPRGTREAYRNAPGWDYFKNIEEFDYSDVKQIKALPQYNSHIGSGKGFIFLESPEPTPFSIFDLDGHTLKTGVVKESQQIELPAGVYLIHFGDDTRKVLVR